MAKRLTDSEKWNDAWFMDLPSKYKLLWLYLLDSCDHAGIWKVNFKVASFCIGQSLEPSEVKRIMTGRVNFLNDEYWQISKFIDFQYGGIKNDTVGKSVAKILKKHNLEGLGSPYEGTKDKDKDMVKEGGVGGIVTIGKYSDGCRFIVIQPKEIGSTKYRINGKDGLTEYFDMHGSVINFPQDIDRFLREKNGAFFNDFMHVFNTFQKFVKNQNK